MITVEEFLEFIKKLSGQEEINDIVLDFRMNIRMEPKDLEDVPSYIPPDVDGYSSHNYEIVFGLPGEIRKTATIQLYEN